jgi:hypothetical protein
MAVLEALGFHRPLRVHPYIMVVVEVVLVRRLARQEARVGEVQGQQVRAVQVAVQTPVVVVVHPMETHPVPADRVS